MKTVFERIKEMNEQEFVKFLEVCTGSCSDYMQENLSADTYYYPNNGKCTENCAIKEKMESYNEDTPQESVPCYGCFKHYLNSDCDVYGYYEKYANITEEGRKG